MANFNDINQTLAPQLKAVISASSSLKNNSRFKKLLEVENINYFSSNSTLFSLLDRTCFW
jgi:hypothetical protein